MTLPVIHDLYNYRSKDKADGAAAGWFSSAGGCRARAHFRECADTALCISAGCCLSAWVFLRKQMKFCKGIMRS